MRLATIAAVLCAALLALAGTAAANTFNVTTTDDDIGSCDPGDCSIREALAAAQANPGDDTVNIPAGHYVLTNGALETDDLGNTTTIVGHSARDTIIDANGQSRVYFINDGTVNLSHVTITGGVASGNESFGSGEGGGIFFDGQHMTLDHVAVLGNKALAQPDFGGQGGGVFAEEAMTITNSLVGGNTADGTGASFSGGQGGGIFGNEALTLTNVTVAGNVALPADPNAQFSHSQGGGIFVNEFGTKFTHVTITGNQSTDTDPSGGLFINDDTTLVNSIVFGNTASGTPGDCTTNGIDTFTEQGVNLHGPGDCFSAAADITADPQLAALADNGGETDTAALAATSPAVDHADAAHCVPTDQRDLPRPAVAGCDIGAFELQPAPPAPPAPPAAVKDTTKPKVTVAGVRAACVTHTVAVRVHAS
ncbi:MAG TPA: choice-of-anchor Q domain-containing protein, partial [Thermoleophilaceae bacterium]|nr:choice-of-anchor Q domain-containing protein [Thermoleophilaceae bacterium]